MDRQLIYPGQIPLESDLLGTNKNAMIALSKLSAAVLGTTTQLNGLACAPNIPAALNVIVGQGEIYSLQNIDGTAYSSIAADTTHTILKQGILLDPVTLSCPAQATAGFSINYLVQVAYTDTDAIPVVLPYYNASNPSQAYSGPANAGTTNNTVRKGACTVSVKVGIAATTGTQVTPAADAGNVGAYVVTVANGQTTIVAGNITIASGAPFISLPVRAVDLAAPTGAGLVGYLGSGAIPTAVGSQVQLLSRTTVYLKSTNTGAQNKAAFLTAIASMTRPGKLLLPDGIYACDPDINLGTLVVSIEGGGKYGTYISNTGLTAGTYFFGVADTTLMEYLRFSEFGLDGGGVVAHGLRLADCNHSKFGEILVTGTTSSAIYLGGYSNDIVETALFSNTGSGLYLTGTLNNVDVTRNKIYANSGFGIFVGSTDSTAGLSISIHDGNAIEGNLIGGIMAFNTKALNIHGNYFERNSVTGYAYTSPESITVRADIHLVAYPGAQIDCQDAYANQSPSISGNHVTPLGSAGVGVSDQDYFVFSSDAQNLEIKNNQLYDTTKVSALVGLYANRVYSKVNGQMIVSGNSTNSVGYKGTFTAASQCLATAHLIQADADIGRKNYVDQNWLAWAALSGTTGAWGRSGNTYLGYPVWSMTDGDFTYGIPIDTTVLSELLGQWVYFGMWVNTQGATTNARLTIGGNSSSGATDYDNASVWKFKSTLQFISATPGTTYCGVQKVGTGAALLLCNPVIAIVGNKFNNFPVPPSVDWARAGFYPYPATGNWNVGDHCRNLTVAVGNPKGWYCTVKPIGSETWVSEGNL
jgi:hypothetical protein